MRGRSPGALLLPILLGAWLGPAPVLAGGKLLRDLAIGSRVVVAALSPAGDLCALATRDGQLSVHSTATLEVLWTREHPARAVPRDLGFSPDGADLLVLTARGELDIFPARGGEHRASIALGSAAGKLCLPASGRYALVGTEAGLLLIDRVAGEVARTLTTELATPESFALDARGRLLVTVGGDRVIRVRTPATGQERAALGRLPARQGNAARLHAMELSDDGAYLAASQADGTLSLLSLRERKLRWATRLDSEVLLAFHPRSLALLTLDTFDPSEEPRSARVRVFTLGSQRPSMTFLAHEGPGRSLRISSSRGFLLTAGGRRDALRIWRLAKEAEGAGREAARVPPRELATTSWDLRREHAPAWGLLRRCTHEALRIPVALDRSGDGALVAALQASGEVLIFEPRSGLLVFLRERGTARSESLALSPEGLRLATSGPRAPLVVSEIPSGRRLFASRETGWRGQRFTPDGQRLVAVRQDVILTLSARDGQVLKSSRLPFLPRQVAISEDTFRVAVAGGRRAEGEVAIFDLDPDRAAPDPLDLGERPVDLALDAWGARLVAVDRRGRVRVHEADSGRELWRLEPTRDRAVAAVLSPDGSRVAWRNPHGTHYIHALPDGAGKVELRAPEGGPGPGTFLPDQAGFALAAGGARGWIVLFGGERP